MKLKTVLVTSFLRTSYCLLLLKLTALVLQSMALNTKMRVVTVKGVLLDEALINR